MSRFYALVKMSLVTSHREVIADDQFKDSWQFMHRKMRE